MEVHKENVEYENNKKSFTEELAQDKFQDGFGSVGPHCYEDVIGLGSGRSQL